MTISFENQVAVITGAGGGLGRTYALLLASKGAKVVVNDLGANVSGDLNIQKERMRPADKVVDEILSLGGKAVANYDSVENGSKIIDTAIKNYGRIDILINNAGILRDISFAKMTDKDFNLVMEIHLKGTYNCTKAAWPYMQKQNYGRILITSSGSGLFGNFGQVNYSSAKSSLLGFGKSLAFEGSKKNIFVNCIAPLAGTRMTETVMSKDLVNLLKPDYVAPVACYLVSDKCLENGSVFEVGAGWVSKIRYERSPGIFFPLNFTIDDVESNWLKIINFSEINKNTYPETLQDSMTLVLNEVLTKTNTKQKNFSNSYKIFKLMDAYLKANPKNAMGIVNNIQCIFEFIIKSSESGTSDQYFTMDLKNDNGNIKEGHSKNPDAVFILSDKLFTEICTGKLNPRLAVQKGIINVKGNTSSMMKFNKDIFPPINEELIEKKLEDALKIYIKGSNNKNIDKLRDLKIKSASILETIFNQISSGEGQKKLEKVKYIYQLDLLTKGSAPISFTLDLKSNPPTAFFGTPEKFDAQFTMTDENFYNIMTGALNPQAAFIQGKMKIKGSMAAAMKFTPDLFKTSAKI
uniref:Hydroxysteroid 17-beta dehydrogenase 4 n=1 Tax=Nephromyces sp. MMRI TaxID=2496275 RepID=A0A3S8V2X9_9APIC|nr:hydroxysteroid 17-beta dehydrogenase 4 [Nephromyces sp. MMRI]